MYKNYNFLTVLSNEKICMVPKLSLKPHTPKDINKDCNLCPEGTDSNWAA